MKKIFLITLLITLISIVPVYAMDLGNSDPDLSSDPTINSTTGYTGSNSAGGSCSGITDFSKFVGCIKGFILQPLVYLLFAVAIVYFLYGVLIYIRKGGDEDDRRAGKDMMIYGIIAIAVMVSVYGLINLVIGTFNFDKSQPTLPIVR